MLEELEIRNYALIEHIQARFSPGFTILTGETGAGKSILVGALGLLLGEKGEAESIRTGCEEASITGVFRVDSSPEALEWLAARGIEPEDGTVLARRVLRTGGRGAIHLQSVQLTRAEMGEFTALLFDIHGQHEHQSLLTIENHRKLLDRYCGIEGEAAALSSEFLLLSQKKKELEALLQADRNRLREIDILQFAIKEIDETALRPGEEGELEQERMVLSQYEKLFSLLEEFDAACTGTGEGAAAGGAIPSLRQAMAALNGISRIAEPLSQLTARMEGAYLEIEDIHRTVRQYQQTLIFDPGRLEEVEQRLHRIRRLEKKYGGSIEEVFAYREEAACRLSELSNWEESVASLEAEIASLEKSVLAKAREISRKRKDGAAVLSRSIQENLAALGMPKGRFIVEVNQRTTEGGKPLCSPSGIDSVEFTISANPGEPAKPLRAIASGGEISRVMLAIKSVLAEKDSVSGLIFDEIDSGIGGQVAVSVGEHLKLLSRHKQVLCISHLASIAVRADNHIKIAKREKDERTVTEIHPLAGEERVAEIARMLSGNSAASVSMAHARELLERFGPGKP
jgi:DNA repair protein RecN (Recombination protein N)